MRSSRAVVLFVLVFSAVICCAQAKSPEKITPPSDYSKEAYVIEHIFSTVSVEEDGSNTRQTEAEISMLSDAGVKAFAVLSFTYTSSNEAVDVDYVRVRKPDGSVIKTPDYNLQDMPAEVTRTAPMYSDVREKHVAVKGLGVGDVLEYKFRIRELKPDVPGQFWYEYSFSTNNIVRDERLELNVPNNKHLTVKGGEYKPEIKEAGERRVYSWKYSNLKRKEEDADAANQTRTPPPPSIQVTTFSKWEEIGRWYSELQKDQVVVTPAIAAKAKELTKGLTTDDEKMRALYNFVSLRIHYVGIDFGIGRYQPHAAEDVLDNEYGDCKDKHTLLASLLKAAGFDAWPALIHGTQKLDAEVPSLSQFNHVITVVPRGDKLIWLDTTPEVAPFGLLMQNLRDKKALVMPIGKDPVLMTTPANPPFRQEQRFNVKAKLGSDGVLKGHIEQKYRGDMEILVRAALRQTPEANWKQLLQNFSYGLGFAGEISNVVVSPVENLSEPVQISYDYDRKDFADWEHRKILAALPPFGIEAASDKNAKTPKEPYPLGALGEISYYSELELPQGSSLEVPKDLNEVDSFAEYHSKNVLEKGVLKTTRRLVLKKNEVPLDEWENFRDMAKAISEDEFNFLDLSNAGEEVAGEDGKDLNAKFMDAVAALQRGDNRLGQELLEKVLAKDPKYHGAHFSLGLALAMQKKNNEAIEEFHKEETIAPDDVRPMQAAASLEVFLKRPAEAEKEWRKLLKVDPTNQDAKTALGQLLSAEGKYSEATEMLEAAVQSSPESKNLQVALGEAYLNAGNVQNAIPHLRTAAEGDEKAVDIMRLNNIAYEVAEKNVELDFAKQCAERALKALDDRAKVRDAERYKLTAQYEYLWDTAGWIYFRQGDYKRAESYVRAAWLLGQDRTVGEHLGEIYEKLGMTKDAAHVYELAYAAAGATETPSAGGPDPAKALKDYEELQKKIEERYRKLTGKNVTSSIYGLQKLPNQKYSISTSEELMRIRDVKLGPTSGYKGSAEFEVVLTPDAKPAAKWVSGSSEMKPLSTKLAAAKYEVEFPVDSAPTLTRRLSVVCSPYAPCSAVMTPVETARNTGTSH